MKDNNTDGSALCKKPVNQGKSDTVIVICVATIVLVLIALTVSWFGLHRKSGSRKGGLVEASPRHAPYTAYISHSATTPEQKEKVGVFT